MGDQTTLRSRAGGARRPLTGGDASSFGLLMWAAVMAVAVAAHAPVGLRSALVISFVCFAPGWALMRHVRLASLLMELVCALGLSVSLLVLGSYIMLASDNWAPFALWWAMTILTVADVSALLLLGGGRRTANRRGPIR